MHRPIHKPIFWSALIVLMGISVLSMAQGRQTNAEEEQAIQLEAVQIQNTAAIQQVGGNNVAEIMQRGNHQASIRQAGNRNQGGIQLRGGLGHSVRLIQDGNRNGADITLRGGRDARINVNQNKNNNELILNLGLRRFADHERTITQNGNGTINIQIPNLSTFRGPDISEINQERGGPNIIITPQENNLGNLGLIQRSGNND